MEIEWGVFKPASAMSVSVIDNSSAPTTVLDSGEPFTVEVKWEVPSPTSDIIGGDFRVRLFVESVGPGPEMQIGATEFVPAVPFQNNYDKTIIVAGGALPGEDVFPSSSGVYKIVAVLQHRNGGSANEVSGFAESPLIQLRTP